jgi:osmotically-inducible protein OsmY
MKRKLTPLALICLLAGMAALGACDSTDDRNANTNRTTNANVATNAPANTNTTARANDDEDDYDTPDGMITAKTKLALLADADTSAFDVDVDTANNVVTLSGKVETDKEKAAAERVAKGIDGVKSVTNALQVVPDSRADAVDDTDDNISKAIDDLFDNDARLDDIDLTSKVNAGVVTLTGTVDNMGEAVRAANAIRKVKGVKRVVTSAVKVDESAAPATTNGNANRNAK